MMYQKALQKIRIQAIGILEQFEEMVVGLCQAQIKRGIPQVGMEVQEKGFLTGTCQHCAKLGCHRSDTTTSLSTHKCQDLTSVSLFFLSLACSHTGHCVE